MSTTITQQPRKNDNATYLFEYPSEHYWNSEQWWSAAFSMLLLYQSAVKDFTGIPLRRCVKQRFPFADETLECKNLKYSEVLVDVKLSRHLFPIWDSRFDGLRPDILIYRKEARLVTLIENKTIRASLGDQLSRYRDIRDFLRREGWSAAFYPLISHGYETTREWKSIEDLDLKLILWEDVLRLMDGIPFFKSLFDVELSQFYRSSEGLG